MARSGKAFAFIAPRNNSAAIHVMDTATGETRMVASGHFTGTPSWSSDETQIALTVTEPSYNVALVEISTGTVTLITDDASFEGFPTWIRARRD